MLLVNYGTKRQAKKASVWKRRDGCGTGWNTLALWAGNHLILSFYRFSFKLHGVAPPLVPNVPAVRNRWSCGLRSYPP